MDVADCLLVAGVAEWLFGDILLDVRSKQANQRSSLIRTVIWRSVAELMAGFCGRWHAMANCWEINSLCWRIGSSRAS